tara:strand:- start:461 stop:625 length:165 start_codon:yes stop_codon:yes gene_type:complete
MEKLDDDSLQDDFCELDDVLDKSYFNDSGELIDLEEDEDNYESYNDEFRSISEL